MRHLSLKLHASLGHVTQADLKGITWLFCCLCSFKAILWSLNSSSRRLSHQIKVRAQRDATGVRLVFATCLRLWLSPACQGSLLLPPPSSLWPWLAFSPSSSLCLFIIPSLHQWLFHRGSSVGFEQCLQPVLRNATEQPFYWQKS